jgi:hypothetical protein
MIKDKNYQVYVNESSKVKFQWLYTIDNPVIDYLDCPGGFGLDKSPARQPLMLSRQTKTNML